MKPLTLILGLFLQLPILMSCSKAPTPIDDGGTTDIQMDTKSEQLVTADNQFGLEIFKQVNTDLQAGDNLMISPLSISLALAMAYNGAEADTKTQMETMLHKQGMSPDQINQAYQSLVEALQSHDTKVDLSIANAIFYRDDFNVKPDFISTDKSYYEAQVEALDFSKTSATLNHVNNWVKDATHNKITSIISQVSAQDVMYLINAIYFKGEWTYQFKKEQTANRVFHSESDGDLQVPTMYLPKTSLQYTSTENFSVLELPYGGKKYSMLIFLPKNGYTANDIISTIDPPHLQSWLDNLSERELEVYLPKFEFAYEKSLIDNLEALGMKDAFDPTKANFSGISDQADLYISAVKHKSYIKVDEQGTEAAAVTGITIGVTSVGPESIFNVDRPFVFAIREKDTNALLFLGKVNNPLKNE